VFGQTGREHEDYLWLIPIVAGGLGAVGCAVFAYMRWRQCAYEAEIRQMGIDLQQKMSGMYKIKVDPARSHCRCVLPLVIHTRLTEIIGASIS
jgi:hypothetical protein